MIRRLFTMTWLGATLIWGGAVIASPLLATGPIGATDGPLLWIAAAAALIPVVIESWDRTKIMLSISGGVAAILGLAAAVYSLLGQDSETDEQLAALLSLGVAGAAVFGSAGFLAVIGLIVVRR